METRAPWLAISSSGQGWQAVFACQFCVQPFDVLLKNRWGFNAAALLSEALDRQKLFIESQFHGNPFTEPGHPNTLALRCIQFPDQGLLLALIGKVSAPRKDEARRKALEYCNQLTSTFPHDYKLYPAFTPQIFEKLTGRELLGNSPGARKIAQVQRFQQQIRTQNGLAYVLGFWHTTDRSDEQIWRTLGNFPDPAMLNISLRPAILATDERQLLWEMKTVSIPHQDISQMHPAQPFDKWIAPFLERRLPPWKRYYLMQVHLLSPAGITDSLVRPIGAALTRETAELLSPGFLTVFPEDDHSAGEWHTRIENLEILPAHDTRLSHLADLADLNEVHSVFRLPYPPETGLPGVTFLGPLAP